MIPTGRFSTAGMAMVMVAVVAGCASSPRRMPPAGPPSMAPVGYMAPVAAPPLQPMPVQPVPMQPAYAPAPYAAPMAPTPVAAAPWPPAANIPAPAQGIAGLTERQPDLCGADQQASAIGQPGSIVPTLGLTKPFRVVEYRGIESQEYNPNRMVFRLDATGTITKIDCG